MYLQLFEVKESENTPIIWVIFQNKTYQIMCHLDLNSIPDGL